MSTIKEPESDWLDQVLQEGLSEPFEENGFNRRVMAALPRAPQRTWLRSLILSASALLACIIGLWLLPGGQVLFNTLSDTLNPLSWNGPLAWISGATVLVGLAGITWSAANAET